MARIHIQDENRDITDVEEIRAFLAPHGIWYEKWDVEGRIGAVEEQTGATAAGLVHVMTRQGGVRARHELERWTVLHQQSTPPADDQQSLVRRVPMPGNSAA